MSQYFKKNSIPLLIELLFLILAVCSFVEITYLNFMFYLALIGYFIYKREYSFEEWKKCVRKSTFWINVFFTILVISGGFILMILIQNHFQSVPLGEFKLKSDTPFKLFLFGMQTILFPPLAEEIFYRKYLIVYDSKKRQQLRYLSVLFYSQQSMLFTRLVSLHI
jgi:hypothetical protein